MTLTWRKIWVKMQATSVMHANKIWILMLTDAGSMKNAFVWICKQGELSPTGLTKTGKIVFAFFILSQWGEVTVYSFSPSAWSQGHWLSNYQKADDKISVCKFSQNVKSKLQLRIKRLAGKQYRSKWGGLLWATSSRSALFANSAIFIFGKLICAICKFSYLHLW